MASEQPSSSAQPNRPQSSSLQEETSSRSPGAANITPPRQESVDPFRSREGSSRQQTPPQVTSEGHEAPRLTIPNPDSTPSDMERGLGGSQPESSGARSQGLGAGQSLPAPRVESGRPLDPFAASREASPVGQHTSVSSPVQSDTPATQVFRDRLLDVAGDFIDQSIQGDRSARPRPAADENLGARVLDVVSDYVQRSPGNDQRSSASPSRPGFVRGDTRTSATGDFSARLINVAGDYVGQTFGTANQNGEGQQGWSTGSRNADRSDIPTRPGYNRGDTHATNESVGRRLVHIAGDYVDQNYGSSNRHSHRQNSQNESPTSADRMVDRPETHARSNREDAQAANSNEGLGARLLHVASDYIPNNFASIQHNLPSLPGRIMHAAEDYGMRRPRTMDTGRSQSVIDHVVPLGTADRGSEEKYPFGSISARIHATLTEARAERNKYAAKAKFTGLALNIAIGLQVLLGSLTTGLSAVATTGKSAAVQTTILGALSTVVASYLARARGSNEPELSITRVKDLEQFIREVENFKTDHGDYIGEDYDPQLNGYRHRFEELLGNANGERKLSSVISSAQSYSPGNNNNNNTNRN